MDAKLSRLLSAADLALGRLEGSTSILPNPNLFLSMYVRREAVLSSQIEGTQASLTDVLQFEIGEGEQERVRDVEEVVNYVAALNHGLRRVQRLPMSLRLIREIHAKLMHGVRGQHRDPGEFRRTQNWIGPAGCTIRDATFVPPPPNQIHRVLGELETFLHDESLPPLIHAGLAHAQFETIHPFLDGNGRMGRLLVTFLLCQGRVLSRPLLYLSHFLKQHRAEYYDRLQAIRVDGAWEPWLAFFLRGVEEVAAEAADRSRRILSMREGYQKTLAGKGKRGGTLARALDVLFEQPVVTAKSLASSLDVTFATANGLIDAFVDLEILKEKTGFRRNRRFDFDPYLKLFSDPGDAPPPPGSVTRA
jgi:Fic family protein